MHFKSSSTFIHVRICTNVIGETGARRIEDKSRKVRIITCFKYGRVNSLLILITLTISKKIPAFLSVSQAKCHLVL